MIWHFLLIYFPNFPNVLSRFPANLATLSQVSPAIAPFLFEYGRTRIIGKNVLCGRSQKHGRLRWRE